MTFDDLIASVSDSMREKGATPELIKAVVDDLRKTAAQEKAARVPVKKSKTQYAIIVSDPEGVLVGKDLTGWTLAMEEESAPQSALDRVHAAGYSFNATRKGQKHPVETIGDIFQCVRGKHWKTGREGEKTQPKTREPVLVIRTDNKLPKEVAQ